MFNSIAMQFSKLASFNHTIEFYAIWNCIIISKLIVIDYFVVKFEK